MAASPAAAAAVVVVPRPRLAEACPESRAAGEADELVAPAGSPEEAAVPGIAACPSVSRSSVRCPPVPADPRASEPCRADAELAWCRAAWCWAVFGAAWFRLA